MVPSVNAEIGKQVPTLFFSNGLILQVLYLQIHKTERKTKCKERKCLLSKTIHPSAILVCSCVYVHSNWLKNLQSTVIAFVVQTSPLSSAPFSLFSLSLSPAFFLWMRSCGCLETSLCFHRLFLRCCSKNVCLITLAFRTLSLS